MTKSAVLHEHNSDEIDIFGFWLYIMTDCILFASLFAVFIVLNSPGAYGPPLKHYINLYYVLGETMFLLFSNLTFGIAIIASYSNRASLTNLFLLFTLFLGACFLGMEINEFINLVNEGYDWTISGTASAFFTLVATHGLHVFFGLLWIVISIIQVAYMGLTSTTNRRLTYLGLFWNFLDIVWIFVFSFVYIYGVL